MIAVPSTPPRLGQAPLLALAVGVSGLVTWLGFALASPGQGLRAYLFAFVFVLAVPLGSFALLALHELVGGVWGILMRRVLEAAARTIPLMALLWVPLAIEAPRLYRWSDPIAVAHDPMLRHAAGYLNQAGFVGRGVLYFACWTGLTFLLDRMSRAYDAHEDPALLRRRQALAAASLLLHAFLVSFALIDWVMSLEAPFSSTIFGLLLGTGQMRVALAFGVVGLLLVRREAPFPRLLDAGRYGDLANLLLALVMAWAYLAFSQLLIVWMGNLPGETLWYLHRTSRRWAVASGLIAVWQFALPFSLLLFRRLKQDPRWLLAIACSCVLGYLLEAAWFVLPSFVPLPWPGVAEVAAVLGLGGTWAAIFLWNLGRRPLLAVPGPRLRRVLGLVREGA